MGLLLKNWYLIGKEGELIDSDSYAFYSWYYFNVFLILIMKYILVEDTLIIKLHFAICFCFFSSFDIINFWYQSNLQSKYSTIIQTIAYVGMSIYRIIILILNKDVTWFAFAVSLDTIIIAILLVYSYYINKNKKVKDFSFSFYLQNLLKQSYPFILSSICYLFMDKWIK